MSGGAPWWFAFEDNKEVPIPEHKMPGDKGVVIRRYAARLGGVEQTSPSLSILCDKLELGTPAGLRALKAGDYVDMSLELLVLPRSSDWEMALRNMYAAREDARALGRPAARAPGGGRGGGEGRVRSDPRKVRHR